MSNLFWLFLKINYKKYLKINICWFFFFLNNRDKKKNKNKNWSKTNSKPDPTMGQNLQIGSVLSLEIRVGLQVAGKPTQPDKSSAVIEFVLIPRYIAWSSLFHFLVEQK